MNFVKGSVFNNPALEVTETCYSFFMSHKEGIDLGELYPELSPAELAEAEYNLMRYVHVVRRIYERIHSEDTEIE